MKEHKTLLSWFALIAVSAALIVSVTACGKKAPPEPLDEAKVFNLSMRK